MRKLFSILSLLPFLLPVNPLRRETLTIGDLTASATPASISLFLTAGLAGGTGHGYSYAIFRSTTAPNFAPNNANLIATVSAFPYTDLKAPKGVVFYKVVGSDDGGNVANAVPAALDLPSKPIPLDLTAALFNETYPAALAPPKTKILVIAIGDSITYGSDLEDPGSFTMGQSAPVTLGKTLANLPNLTVTGANCGIGGTTTGNWLPSFTTQGRYQAMKQTALALVGGIPDAVPVFSIMLGANDSADSSHIGAPMSASTYGANLVAIGKQLLVDFPNAKVVLHHPTYYTPDMPPVASGENGEDRYARLYTYEAQIQTAVNAINAAHPGSAFAGDAYAFNYFAFNYASEMSAGTAGDGNYYLHPNAEGAAHLGAYWGNAIYSSIFGSKTGAILVTSVTSTGATLTATDPFGDDGTFTYQWYRGATASFAPGTGNAITGATSLQLHDSGLTAAKTYYYALGRTHLGATTFLRASVATAAGSYALAGPANGYAKATASFTVVAPAPLYGTVTVTPSDNGAGGKFTPTTLTLASTGSTIPATFVYTPSATALGPVQLSATNSAGLTNPAAFTYTIFGKASGYGLSTTGKTTIQIGQPAPIRISLVPVGDATITPVTITPSVAGVKGTFAPTSVTLSLTTQSATLRFTPSATGTASITATNNGTFHNPSALSLTVQNLLISTFTLSPTSVRGGTSTKATISLNLPAPLGGLTVTVSSNSASATPPATFLIPSGVQTTSFTIPTKAVAATTKATITVVGAGTTRTATLTLTH